MVDDMIGAVVWARLVERESDCFSLPLAITDSLLYEVPIGLCREDCLPVMRYSLSLVNRSPSTPVDNMGV